MIINAITSLLRAVLPNGTRIGPATDKKKVSAAENRVIFTRIDSDTAQTDEGSSGIVTERYQIDVFAATLTAAETMLAKLRKTWAANGSGGIENYKGTIDTTRIDRIAFESGSFQTQDAIEGEAGTFARCLQDVVVTYRE